MASHCPPHRVETGRARALGSQLHVCREGLWCTPHSWQDPRGTQGGSCHSVEFLAVCNVHFFVHIREGKIGMCIISEY